VAGPRQAHIGGVIVEIPATGERIEARLIRDDPSGPLSLTLGRSGHVTYVLTAMLDIGWRIVEATPDERALMAAHGITAA
jgi:hypothetical protein